MAMYFFHSKGDEVKRNDMLMREHGELKATTDNIWGIRGEKATGSKKFTQWEQIPTTLSNGVINPPTALLMNTHNNISIGSR